MNADYEKYKHLVFNGILPKGLSFTDHHSEKLPYFFTASKTLEKVIIQPNKFIVLLDNGFLVYANYGAASKKWLTIDEENIFLGHGILHKGLCTVTVDK